MLDRARYRCPACRSSVPAMVVWAAGDACPHCGSALKVESRRPDGSPAPLDGMLSPVLPTTSSRGRGRRERLGTALTGLARELADARREIAALRRENVALRARLEHDGEERSAGGG